MYNYTLDLNSVTSNLLLFQQECLILLRTGPFTLLLILPDFFAGSAPGADPVVPLTTASTTTTTTPRVGNSTLYYNDTMMTYFQAREKCRDLDSDLVEMRTEEEWDEVRNHGSLLTLRVVQKRHDCCLKVLAQPCNVLQ